MAVSPPLADVLAVSTEKGLDRVAKKILEVVRPDLGDLVSVYPGIAQDPASRSKTLSGSFEGEYLVEGYDPTGIQYRGRATVSEHEGVLVIESTIGTRTYVCQGRMDGTRLNVYGDFEVEYFVKADGSMLGAWGKGGLETLTPIDKPIGTKLGGYSITEVPDYGDS